MFTLLFKKPAIIGFIGIISLFFIASCDTDPQQSKQKPNAEKIKAKPKNTRISTQQEDEQVVKQILMRGQLEEKRKEAPERIKKKMQSKLSNKSSNARKRRIEIEKQLLRSELKNEMPVKKRGMRSRFHAKAPSVTTSKPTIPQPETKGFFDKTILRGASKDSGSEWKPMNSEPRRIPKAVTDRKKAEDDQEITKSGRTNTAKTSSKTWNRSKLKTNLVRLKIGDKEELALKGVQAHVKVDGFKARVLMDFYFYNHHPRNYEGTFQLRLPDGATPYYLAFGNTVYQSKSTHLAKPQFFSMKTMQKMKLSPQGISDARSRSWDHVKVARMVPKAKAALAYHSTVRQKIDPALLEWSGTGVFNGRIFPLQARKLHRIVIGYDVNLTRSDKRLKLKFKLPGNTTNRVIHFDVAKLNKSVITLNDLKPAEEDRQRSFYYVDNPQQDVFNLEISNVPTLAIQGNDTKTGPYFATRIAPTLAAKLSVKVKDKALFLVDTSLSANPDNFNKSLKTLKAILSNNDKRIKEFAVVFFNIRSHSWKEKFVQNNQQNRDALMDYANTLTLEGATDIENAFQSVFQAPNKSFKPEDADLFLLSDGAITWGENHANAIARLVKARFNNKIFVYTTGASGRNNALFSLLANTSKGSVFSISDETQIDKAAVAFRQSSWKLDKVSVDGGSDILVAGNPVEIYQHQTLMITGRGSLKANSKVTLSLSGNGVSKTITMPIAQVIQSGIAPRAFGQIAVQQMETLKPEGSDEINAYALYFRITGQTASLVMLDSEADYKRYKIKPQENEFLVKKKLATTILDAIKAVLAKSRFSAKQSFLDLVARLEKMQGVKLSFNASIKHAIKLLPEEVFNFKPNQANSIQSSPLLKATIPTRYLKNLKLSAVDFKTITREYDRRLKAKQGHLAIVALSNLIESNPGDVKLLRMISYYALDKNKHRDAFYLLRKVAEMRPYEPQTYLAIARILVESNQLDLASLYYEIVINGHWNREYGQFTLLAKIEYRQLLRRITQSGSSAKIADYSKMRIGSLAKSGSPNSDLLISIEWNTDGTDIDLHIVEPHGEEIYYGHKRSKKGGKLTRDITTGFGPEIYNIKKARTGVYDIGLKYFSNNSNRASLRTTALVHIYRNIGRKNQSMERKVILLQSKSKKQWISKVKYK